VVPVLLLMRAVAAALVVIAVAFINWTWMFTVPNCLSIGDISRRR